MSRIILHYLASTPCHPQAGGGYNGSYPFHPRSRSTPWRRNIMPILIPCKCGKQLRVKDDLAGKRIKCPACAAMLTVPVPAVEDDDPVVPELASAEDVAHTPEPSRAKKRSRPEKGEEEADSDVEPAEKAGKRPRAADGANPYWVRAGDLLALSEEAIYLASLNEKEMRRTRAALDDGEPPALVLDGASLVISY